MLLYWFLFFFFATAALLTTRPPALASHGATARPFRAPIAGGDQLQPIEIRYSLYFASLIPVVLIGFRYRVGTDWGAYANMFARLRSGSLEGSMRQVEIGYA